MPLSKRVPTSGPTNVVASTIGNFNNALSSGIQRVIDAVVDFSYQGGDIISPIGQSASELGSTLSNIGYILRAGGSKSLSKKFTDIGGKLSTGGAVVDQIGGAMRNIPGEGALSQIGKAEAELDDIKRRERKKQKQLPQKSKRKQVNAKKSRGGWTGRRGHKRQTGTYTRMK